MTPVWHATIIYTPLFFGRHMELFVQFYQSHVKNLVEIFQLVTPFILTMETARSPEMLVSYCNTTWPSQPRRPWHKSSL